MSTAIPDPTPSEWELSLAKAKALAATATFGKTVLGPERDFGSAILTDGNVRIVTFAQSSYEADLARDAVLAALAFVAESYGEPASATQQHAQEELSDMTNIKTWRQRMRLFASTAVPEIRARDAEIAELRAALASQASKDAEVSEGVKAMAYRLLWLAFVWNDHNFDAAHKEAREEAKKWGIHSLDEANAFLESLNTPSPAQAQPLADATPVRAKP
jgi:hypothetical protein